MFLVILRRIARDGRLGARGLLTWVGTFRCSSLSLLLVLAAGGWGVMIAEASLSLLVPLPEWFVRGLATQVVIQPVEVMGRSFSRADEEGEQAACLLGGECSEGR